MNPAEVQLKTQESELETNNHAFKLRQMKKFYRGAIPNHRMELGWTSPLKMGPIVQEQNERAEMLPKQPTL